MPKTLIDIWNEREDLQKAMPKGIQSGSPDNKKLNDWWNVHGQKEYSDVNLRPAGSLKHTLPPEGGDKRLPSGKIYQMTLLSM